MKDPHYTDYADYGFQEGLYRVAKETSVLGKISFGVLT
jgi:hypothetical protein